MTLPFLDITAPGFSTRSAQVHAARAASWCARTPFGFAVLRHRQAGLLLRDRRLRQGSHAWPDIVGLTGAFARFWAGSIISLEGPAHKALRRIAQVALAEEHITALVPRFEQIAETLCDRLEGGAPFDLVDGFSEPFAGQAIATLLGRPLAQAPQIAQDASCLGLAMGPQALQHEARADAACDRLMALADEMLRSPPPNGFVSRMIPVAGDTAWEDLQNLIVISIFGGVDTTRAQLAFAAHLFARHPDQWDWLRNHPDAVPRALDEVIRLRPTTTWASRETLEDITLDGVTLPAGATVHVLVHASGTDPLIGHDGGFDIRAARRTHFGFGGGAHHCLGHVVARTDMAAALRVWLRRWPRIEMAGDPAFLPDSGNTSPLAMPVRVGGT